INDTQMGFITRKSTGWKYDDNDLSSDPSGWTSAGFDDSGWGEGQAGLGNGYAGLNTIIARYEGYYYFRKKFDITNISDVQAAKLFVYSDDGADVYVNGNLIDNNVDSSHTAAYWNREIDINTTDLVEGENIVAAKLRNRRTCFFIWCWDTDVAFDLEFTGSSSELIEQAKKKAMVVMSDGEANQECTRQGNSGDLNNDGQYDTAKDDAIKAACDAYADYGITVYSVGFGIGADATTLQYMANCTDGSYFSSANYEELRDTYLIIANELIEFTETQRVNQTDILTSILYPDSYIEFNFTPEVPAPVYGQIPITAEGNRFGNNVSEGNLFIPDGNTLIDLTATSYSADKWTDLVSVYNVLGNYTAFNLSKYGSYYRDVGDAFTVNVPVSKIVIGDNNTITVKTATDPGNMTGGSEYNKLIYTVRIDSLLDYGGVFLESEGCIWHVEFEDETNDTIKIPSDYSGAEQCYYANATYSTNDALDDATYRLFSNLDFDGDGKLEVSLDENNIDLDTLTVSDVPSLWGPAIVEVRIW
ncbi:hypothetical protein JW707_00870, partial [Candidatus Woesearchaeota archaeon]|nr:hypothetical protein [Candidatus Woesearchaeota archaeon]